MEIGLLLILQDQDGLSHGQKPVTFTDETTIKELSKAINSFMCIHQDYQELYHNGKQIISLNSTLKQIGVKDGDEILIALFPGDPVDLQATKAVDLEIEQN
ncbi:unnamed protein product [Caenorhabditis auriculariae]|uniref:Ubiquitin-like domain-containing protein n=1 Tax=Caenorhabditis auriculariae TaxID=2777116 RepID=A0A8S1HPQ6_9PELO|nr:unnamed protein product [Caenorhabditis auriculariae]